MMPVTGDVKQALYGAARQGESLAALRGCHSRAGGEVESRPAPIPVLGPAEILSAVGVRGALASQRMRARRVLISC